MAAVVLRGASTIGGVGLGYEYGISGMWLVFAIGCGILLLSFGFATKINRLRVYTVIQMLELRYGPRREPGFWRHVGVHLDARGDLDYRVRNDLRCLVRHR
jgi:Na+(H+)/acetate symporter ActP